jgi:hypothetical protein
VAFIAQDVKPRDIIEWFWVKDIADLVWEARRLRFYKALLTRIRMPKAGGWLLAEVYEPETAEGLVRDYQACIKGSILEVQGALDALGLPEDAFAVSTAAPDLSCQVRLRPKAPIGVQFCPVFIVYPLIWHLKQRPDLG